MTRFSRSLGFGSSWLVLVLVMAGCGGDDGAAMMPDAEVTLPVGPVALAPTLENTVLPNIENSPAHLIAADPKLEGFDVWPLVFDVDRIASTDRCEIVLIHGDGEEQRFDGEIDEGRCLASWDGRDREGAYAAPGVYGVRGDLYRRDRVVATSETSLEVIRIGFRRIQMRGEGRVSLLYRAVDGRRGSFYEIDTRRVPWRLGPDDAEESGAVALELADGALRELPAPWESVTSPPLDESSPDGVEADTHNFPTAWVAGSQTELIVTLATGVAGGSGDGTPQTVDVRVVMPDGLERVGAAPTYRDGQTMLVRTQESLVPNVDRYDVSLAWGFEVRAMGEADWLRLPGQVTTTHRLYGLVAAPIFDQTRIPHRAWVDVVDQVAEWVGGASADADEVGGAIVEGVYQTLGLEYDRRRGASFYTRYTSSGYGGAVFDLSGFQERTNGSTINCTDAASIVSAFSNMVGIDFRYHIIRHNTAGGFRLNYLQGIGSPEFTYSPFFSGNPSFSYPAIVGGPLESYTVFDATLAVDGDGTPASPPLMQLLVQGILPAEYLEALSPDHENVRVFQDQKVRIQ